jgi:hypothetical protein
MMLIARISLIACLSALACECAANMGVKNMAQQFPPGAQDPKLPHPGIVTFVYLWNNSREVDSADKVPDRIKFFCVDERDNEVAREKAIWCIPVVEIETFSVDEHGKAVVPKDADFIHIRAYGPNHTFLKSTVTPPSRKPPADLLDRSPQSIPQNTGSQSPQSFAPRQSGYERSDRRVLLQQKRLNWCARVKAWLGIA